MRDAFRRLGIDAVDQRVARDVTTDKSDGDRLEFVSVERLLATITQATRLRFVPALREPDLNRRDLVKLRRELRVYRDAVGELREALGSEDETGQGLSKGRFALGERQLAELHSYLRQASKLITHEFTDGVAEAEPVQRPTEQTASR